MTTVYLVVGMAGSYDDHVIWPVMAYHDESLALEHVNRATKRASEIGRWISPSGNCYSVARLQGESLPKNEFDPDMMKSSYPTNYAYWKVLLSNE